MTVDIYAAPQDMQTLKEQPYYYNKLLDVAARATSPAISAFIAVSETDEILGSVRLPAKPQITKRQLGPRYRNARLD